MTAPAALADRFGRSPLAVVVAPAGYGKTTLLGVWRERSSDRSWGLASFESFHRSNVLDAGHALVRTMTEVGVPAESTIPLLALLPPDGTQFGDDFVDAAAERLRALTHRWVLALDDVQGLPTVAQRDLGRLVSNVADDDHRIVVATRREPPWPVRRWQVSGFADLITANELLLSVDYVAELLPPALKSVAPRVHAATGGWAVAVETVRWHLDVAPAAEIEDAVLDLVDYVQEEMLQSIEPVEAQILTRTSILEAFPASVARAVSDDPHAPVVLDDLVSRTSLLMRIDGRFTYHPVLREALRRQLVASEPGLEPGLHRRAADAWLDEPASFAALASAVNHLLEANQWDQVLALLRSRWPEIDQNSRFDLFVGWLEAIPRRHWQNDAEVMLLYGWANLRIGRGAKALQGLQEPALARNPHAAAIARVTYASSIAWSTDPHHVPALVEQSRPALVALDQDERLRVIPAYPGVIGFALAGDIAVAQSQVMAGRFDDASEGLERVLMSRSDIAPTNVLGLCGAHAFVLAMQGRLAAASERVDEALRLAEDTVSADHVRAAPAVIASAAIAELRGDRLLALQRLDHAARSCRSVRAANLLRMADLVGAMCGERTTFLQDVEPALTPAPLPLVDQFVRSASARRRARRGDISGAEEELRTTTPHELTLSAWVEVLLMAHDRRFVARWIRSQPNPTSPLAEIVRALVMATTAEEGDQVTAHAAAAARAATPDHLIGAVLGAPSQLWSRPTATNSGHPLLLEAVQLVLSAGDDDMSEPLTPREMDLLRLLPLSLSVNELAERLFVSTSTVKWHRAHLYRKLGVTSRHAAIEVAAERGLLVNRQPRPGSRVIIGPS